VLRAELARLELDHDVAAEPEVVEEQVREELVAAHLQADLAAHEGEADAHLHQRVADVEHHGPLDLALVRLLAEAEKVKYVRACRFRLRCMDRTSRAQLWVRAWST